MQIIPFVGFNNVYVVLTMFIYIYISISIQKKYFFCLWSEPLGHSHVGSLSTNEEQRRVGS